MPPKPSKRPSLFAAWAKQEAEAKAREEKKRPFEQGEVVSLSDIEDAKETEMWPVFNPDNTHGRPQSPPKLKIEYTPQEILKEKGYDAAAGDSIIYPSGEVIRPYELSILKTCLSVNTSVCLPGSVCPIHIVVLTFLNFKRWFPNGYFIFCSNESPDNFKSSCIVNGIDEKEITVCATFNAFKQKKAENFSPFIVCTPQTMQKIVETDNPIISRIRCIAVCMDSGEQSQKYARFVGPLVGKGNLFRLLITTPSRPSKSHKIAPISTRQKTITSMFITEWEEPSATNGLFRRAVVPSKIEPLMWTNEDLTPDAVELLASWKEGAEVILNEFSNSVPLPSKNIEDLLNIEWVELLAEADALQFGIKCLICTFLTTAYRHLLLNGARVFYLFCSAPIYNQSPSIQSMNSHVKYQKLVEKVQSYMKNENPIRGVILCESLQLSRTVCESLSSIPDLKVVLGVPSSTEIPPEHQTTTRRFNSMTGLFYENKNTVALMSFESNDETVFHALDTAISNELHFIIAMGRKSLCMVEYHKKKYYVFLNDTYEPLRKLDSKIVQEADELTDREVNNMVTGAVGSVNKYAFKFEQSNLAIDVRKKKMRFVKFAEGQLMQPPDLTRRGKRAHARDDNDGEEMPNSVEKRKRGRPRNSTVIDTTANIEPEAEDFTPIRPISASSEKSVNDGDKINDTLEKRKRGKPRKLAASKETIETGESTSSNQPVVFTNSSPSNTVVDKEKTLKNPKESPEKKKQRGRPRKNVAVKEFRNDTPAVATSQALEIGEDVSPIETDVPSEAMMDPVALARVRKLDEVMEKLDRILLMKLPPRSI